MMKENKHKVEIMAPVGSYESLAAALQGGAGSVYFGVGRLNMRSRSAQTFDLEDMEKIVGICRGKGVKTYLTLNTIIYDEEMDEMQRIVEGAKLAGISAIIASDMSVMEVARSQGVEVHISTQCNVSNLEAVRFYARYADVVVLARELSLRQVHSIVKGIEREEIKGPGGKLVEIELFVHGALCMAVSGKCYLSLDNMKYSANRGACLQLCRRGYLVTDKEEGYELEVDHEYIMSPKDLCTIGIVDKIMNAGVRVFKIEGRGRSADYVKEVTRSYREAVAAVEDGSYSMEKVEIWTQRLSKVFNRGFWEGYYLGRTMGEWSERYGSQATQRKIYVGKISNYFARLGVAEITLETRSVKTGDALMVIGPTTGVMDFIVDEMRVDNRVVEVSEKGQKCSLKVEQTVRRGDKVFLVVESQDLF